MIERRDTMEFFRGAAADQFRIHIRKPWLPRSGPMVNHKALTSAVLDSRKALDKRAWAKQRVFDPDGVRIAFTGGPDCTDPTRIYPVLDTLIAQLPNPILMQGPPPPG